IAILRQILLKALHHRTKDEMLAVTNLIDHLAHFAADIQILVRQIQQFYLHRDIDKRKGGKTKDVVLFACPSYPSLQFISNYRCPKGGTMMFRTSLALCVSILAIAGQSLAGPVTYTIDPNQSSLLASGLLAG